MWGKKTVVKYNQEGLRSNNWECLHSVKQLHIEKSEFMKYSS